MAWFFLFLSALGYAVQQGAISQTQAVIIAAVVLLVWAYYRQHSPD